jgi:ABC-type transport system involved in cytochrome c biogenesis permease subunit
MANYLLLLLVVAAGVSHSAMAGERSFSAGPIGSIIVLEEGRKKPLDTYARNKLLQFSGRQSIHGSSAIDWMTRVLFDSQTADTESVFLINNPEILHALELSPRPGRRYNFVELYGAQKQLNEQFQAALRIPQKERSLFENEILRVHENYVEYGSLSSMFSFLNPHESFRIKDSTLAAQLGFQKEADLSYVDLLMRSEILSDKMVHLQPGKIDRSESEMALISLVRAMYQFATTIGNPPPHCLVMLGDSGETWVSPWGLIAQKKSNALYDKSMKSLMQVRKAYLDKDGKRLKTAVREFNAIIQEESSSDKARDPALELVYNNVGSFSKAKIALGLAALLALIAVFNTAASVYWAGVALVGAAWLLMTFGLVLRMLIMGHPPLANLYETFVVVAWLTVLIGAVLELLRLKPIGLLTASITGFLFLHIAGKYAGDGDTMGMLIAVLDSSFWLTTHIVTITLGYAGCMAAGVISHVYLIQTLARKTEASKLRAIEGAVYGTLCFGMLFTVVGTILGGMWADQAWGRFWGWDPKENGALLIILWCLTSLHARSAGIIKGVGVAVSAIVGAILVMCAWIGVNLLGVGLHSYGFTSAGVTTLLTYAGSEIAFLIVIGLFFKLRKKKPS